MLLHIVSQKPLPSAASERNGSLELQLAVGFCVYRVLSWMAARFHLSGSHGCQYELLFQLIWTKNRDLAALGSLQFVSPAIFILLTLADPSVDISAQDDR